MLRHALPLLLLLLSLQGPAAADDLYTGEVRVPDQGEAARATAMSEALGQVLVKLSGNPAAAADPDVASALADPAPLVQAWHYRQDVDRSGPAPALVLYLAASFEPRAVQRLMAGAGLTQWARERPPIAAFVAIENEGGVRLASAGELGPLLRRGNERGIRLEAGPVGEESRPLVLAAAERQNLARLRAQAAAAGAPGLLAARLYGTAEGVYARAAFSDGEREESFEVRADDRGMALRALADGVADRLAARYAFSAADSEPVAVAVTVRGIRSAADYARAQSFLASLSIVRRIEPRAADGETLTLGLVVAGGGERLRQVLALDSTLAPAGEGGDGTLVLELR
jgi:hypothetical protein